MSRRSLANPLVLDADDALRCQLEQLRYRFYVPVGVFRAGVAQIGREFDHLARRVLAHAVPVDHRARREAVAEVVDAWSTAMTVMLLLVPQPEPLAHQREVIAGTAIPEPLAVAGDEERVRRTTQQSVALACVVAQTCRNALGERDEPLPSALAAPAPQ